MTAIKNRIRKNQRKLGLWAQKHQIECFRVYDRDIPEYPFIVDKYKDNLVVFDRCDPKLDDSPGKQGHRRELTEALCEVFETEEKNIVYKQRSRQRGRQQYSRLSHTRKPFVVREGEVLFEVNLHDYLDTGLFLDHRIVRRKIAELAQGKRFLNLFSYTGAVTVYAALGGAHSSISVDLSKTYTEWARRNLALNRVPIAKHKLIAKDVLEFLTTPKTATIGKFDLIFLDPPTFSNSKKMDGSFDVQRDHNLLIENCMMLLAKDGLLIFSNNKRGFRLSESIAQVYHCRDITTSTIPKDFRDGKIHSVFEIRHA